SGKYRSGASLPEGSRAHDSAKRGSRTMAKRLNPGNYAIVDAVREIARRHEATPAQVALRWILDRPSVSTVILGARTEAHLKANMGATGIALDDESARRLEELSFLRPGYPYELI